MEENFIYKIKENKGKIVTTILTIFVIALLFLLNWTETAFDIFNFKETISTLIIVYISCNIIYTIHYRQSKEEKENHNINYIGSKKQYGDRLYILKNSYDRKDINYYGKQYNEENKKNKIKELIESVGLIEEDIKLNTKKQLIERYNRIGIKIEKYQIKIWKKCKKGKIKYDKLDVNILIHDCDSGNNVNDETGTNRSSNKNERKRLITFNVSKFITSFAVACISINFITNPSIETLVKFFIEISAVVTAYLNAIMDSDKYIQDRIVEFNKRTTTINSAQIWFKSHPEYKEYTLKYLYGDLLEEAVEQEQKQEENV